MHSGNDVSDTLLDYANVSLNFSNMFFGNRGVNNSILHQLIYGLVEFHAHVDSFYYHATSGIDFHKPLSELG